MDKNNHQSDERVSEHYQTIDPRAFESLLHILLSSAPVDARKALGSNVEWERSAAAARIAKQAMSKLGEYRIERRVGHPSNAARDAKPAVCADAA